MRYSPGGIGRSALGLSLAAVAGMVAGCGAATAGGPGDGRTLRLAVGEDIKTLDPAVSSDWDSQPLVRMLYHGLLDYDDGTKLVPWLARALPEVSPDARTFTFRLRPGIHFANGRELVAEDCAYAIARSLHPATKSWGEGFLRNIAGAGEFTAARAREPRREDGSAGGWTEAPLRVKGLETPDRYTLRVRLKEPDPAFPYLMTMTFTYPVPREEVERRGRDFERQPVGTGPFLLREWRRGLRLRFGRNPRFDAGPNPRLERVEVMVGADELIQQMMFERGELDLIARIAEPDFARIIRDPAWEDRLVTTPSNETSSFFMNTEMKPFTDRRVRQAMNYGIDRRRVLRMINHRGVAARGVIPPAMPGFNPKLFAYDYNPEKAKALLREAGYPDGFSVPLWVGSATRSVKLAQAVQQDLARIGVRVELKTVAGTVAGQAYRKRRNVPFGLQSWYMDYPDPGNFLETFLSGDRITDEDCLNFSFYANPRSDALLRQTRRELDPRRRLRFYQQAEEVIVREAPWMFLYHPVRHRLRQRWLKGFTPHPVWPGRYERLWIER